jgi:hypothetical protein
LESPSRANWAICRSCAVSGLARSDDAFAAAEQATADPDELWFSTFALVELIEAASRPAFASISRETVGWAQRAARDLVLRAIGSDTDTGIGSLHD